mgnify:CR=1 FL=1
MTSYVDGLARLLDELRTEGAVPSSRLSDRQRKKLQSLFTGKILREEPSGHGHRVVVSERESLERFIQDRYPSGLCDDREESTSDRKSGIKRRRDSKAPAKTLADLSLFKVFEEGLMTSGNRRVNPVLTTKETGCFTITERFLDRWRYNGILGSVENYEAFLHVKSFSDFGRDFFPDGFLYASGVLSNRLLNWMKDQPGLSRMVHFGDYDPVGLREYFRLRKELHIPVEFYCPDNLEELFEHYSNRSLLESEKSKEIFEDIRKQSTEDGEIAKVINLIEHYNAGLEQEILIEE